jgi:hypothetical protein
MSLIRASLGAVIVATIVLAGALVIAALQPSQAERAEKAFGACVAAIPHPARPWPYLSNGRAARARVVALLEYQDRCARSSGLAVDTQSPVLTIARKVLRREPSTDNRVWYYRECVANIPSDYDAFGRLSEERTCGLDDGGLRMQQVWLAAGFSLFVRGVRLHPVTRRWEERVRNGTWWITPCSR